MGEAKRRSRAQRDWEATGRKLGDGPIEEKHHEHMVALAEVLNEVFNGKDTSADRKVGFVLMVFPFGDQTGRCNYISNGADRKDIILLMREMIARFEGQPEVRGTA